MSVNDATRRVQARRRTVVRVGFIALFVASATACIFEESTYQGGGRLDQNATATQAKTEDPPRPTTSTPTSVPDAARDATPPIIVEAGGD